MITKTGSIDLNALPKSALNLLYKDERDTQYINASIKQKIQQGLELINSKTLWRDKESAIVSVYLLAASLVANNCVDLNKYIDITVYNKNDIDKE